MARPEENKYNRAAGSGVILAGSKPMRRGKWNVYETTNPDIGHFDRCFWIECVDRYMHDNEWIENALEELSHFFDANFNDNLILLAYTHIRVMGGVTTLDGKCQAGRVYRQEKERAKKKKPKWPDTHLVTGYELRTCHADAVAFLTLWTGSYEGNNS